MKCCFLTFGCKVNACETVGMQNLLSTHGHQITSRPEDADLAVINSCTVTASGDHRTLSAIQRLRKMNPDMILVLTGCYVQAFPEEAAAIPEADILIGTKERERLPQLIDELIQSRSRNQTEPVVCISEYQSDDAFEALPCGDASQNTRAFLKIQDGCNCFCSYCIIPYARGRCRSMPPDQLRMAVENAAKNQQREVVLCGINLAFYGEAWNGSLLDAAQICHETDGIDRIRFGSLEPERITKDLLLGLAAMPEFCPQFHLSLQSGCDRTLRAMNRRYTTTEYAAICGMIREFFPDCAITTDIMVGFPGETEEDFAASLAFARAMDFAKIHVFRYSPRPGTPAAKRPEQIPDSIKTRRMQQMQALSGQLSAAFLKKHVGQRLSVLFERERGDGFHTGHAADGSVIKIPQKNPKKSLRKSLICVTIEKSDDAACYGTLSDSTAANPT